MGKVYLARDVNLGNRKVALKTMMMEAVLHGAGTQQREQFAERFRREAISAAVLSHPNIVTIHDAGQDGETPYIVMEFVEGTDLRSVLKQRPLKIREKLRILRATASALDYAHSHKIIHRDVKPENIMLRADGEVKLTDFGIAKNLEAGTLTLAQSTDGRMLLGTPQYMPCEVLENQPWGPRGDQYSLAVVAYELLLGRPPFEAQTLFALLRQIAVEPLPPREQVNPDFPADAYAVLSRALSKRPDERFASCTEFIEYLSEALSEAEAAESALEREEKDWNRVRETRDVSQLLQFEKKYPRSRHLEELRQRIEFLRFSEEMDWRGVKDSTDASKLREFIEKHPHSSHRSEAQRRLKELEAERTAWENIRDSADPFLFEQFLNSFPSGAFAQPARWRLDFLRAEAQAWEEARQADAEPQLEAYLCPLSEWPARRQGAGTPQRNSQGGAGVESRGVQPDA